MPRLSAVFFSFSLLAASLTLVVPRAVLAIDATDLQAAIENAKTAADQEAIADYFDAQAKAALATVQEHREMLATYRKSPKPAAGKPSQRSMQAHCEKLIADYQAAAKEYEAMAALHRESAAAIK